MKRAIIILVVVFPLLVSCGSKDWDGPTAATTDPYVTEVSPPNGATNVSTTGDIIAYFSKDIDPSTLPGNFYLDPPAAGVLYYDVALRAAIIRPSGLSSNTLYYVYLTTGIKDTTGRRMLNGYSWYFITGPGLWVESSS